MTARVLAMALACGLVVAAAPLRADSGALFGEGSEEAALADAVTARSGGIGSLAFNPGALADMERPELQILAHGGRLDLRFRRTGEGEQDRSRRIAGFGFGLGGPLPEPVGFLRVGGAVHVPSRHALRLEAPPRSDVPTFPLYADRADRTALTLGAAANLLGRFQLGLAMTLAPRLAAPTEVEFASAREGETEGRLLVDVERELQIGLAWLVGIRYEVLTNKLAFGFSYHEAVVTRAQGDNITRAGTLVTFDPIDFYDFLEPERFRWGLWARPVPRLALSADVVWQRWSRFRTIHNRVPEPRFDDVALVRVGAEWSATPWLVVRGGYAYEPSPVPAQDGVTNFLDAGRHVLAAGGGVDFGALGLADLRLDGHLRAHVTGWQRERKDASRLPDASPDEGHQIENLGYPGFESRAWFLQAGITLTVWLGERRAEGGEP